MAARQANTTEMEAIELEPAVIATLRTLETHRVEHIVVGDVAHALQGGGRFVNAVAIVPSGYARNVERLSNALSAIDAELRVPGENRTQAVDLRAVRALGRCVLATQYADVEIDFEPSGTAGYPDLYLDARPHELPTGIAPQIASPEDLHRIESAGGQISRIA